MQIPKKIIFFHLLLMHYVLPVPAWLWQIHCKPCGFGCHGCMTKPIKHVLWSCRKITQVWKRVLRLPVFIHANCVITWGVVRWGILEGQLLHEKEDIMEAFHIVPPHVQMVQPFLFDTLQIRDDIIWKTNSSILM